MKSLIICAFFIILSLSVSGQNFVTAFYAYRQMETRPLYEKRVAKTLKNYNRVLAHELSAVLKNYKVEKGFGFNSADSVFILLFSPDESPFFCNVILWSGMDTISYLQVTQRNARGKKLRGIRPTDPDSNLNTLAGYQTVSELDSVMNLVQGRNFNVLRNLGKGQNIMGGGSYSIYLAFKCEGGYEINSVHLEKFFIPVTYRKL